MRLLIIESDREQSDRLIDRLTESGFIAHLAISVRHALDNDLAKGVAAIILDNGLRYGPILPEVCHLRDAGVNQPLVVLSNKGDWRERVECLDAGADDFMIKPVRSEEVVARIRAIVRRGAGHSNDRIVLGNLDIDLKARGAWLDGACLSLARNEFRFLRLFALNVDGILSQTDLLDQLSSDRLRPSNNAVEVQINRLRRKVGADRIQTIRGVGYRFVSGASDTASDAAVTRDPCRADCGDPEADASD